MKSTRAILSVAYTPSGTSSGRLVSGFLRYVHHRDHENLRSVDPRDKGLEGLVRYVSFRDRAAPDGRLFDRERTVGARERRAFLAYVRRSLVDVRGSRQPRSVYRFVLSPEDARGLDLRDLARKTMVQFEREAGGQLRWIAAEHRNTGHPHVHIVVAARREVAPERFREVRVTRERLANMKLALGAEIQRERSLEPERSLVERLFDASREPERSPGRGRRAGLSLLLGVLGGLQRAMGRYARYQEHVFESTWDKREKEERLRRERELARKRELDRGWER